MQIKVRTVEVSSYWIPDEDIPKSMRKWSRRKIADYFRERFQCQTIHEHFYIDNYIFKLEKDE